MAGDMDSDGDLDVVASSWINYWEDPQRQSLIWFENDGKQNFTRHNIASKPPGIVSLELKDITGDGRLDIVAGVFRIDMLNQTLAADATAKGEAENAAKPDQEILHARVILLENAAGRDSSPQ